MKLIYVLAAAILLNTGFTTNSRYIPQTKDTDEWIFDKVRAQTLQFKNGKSYKTDLYDLKYIGQIANNNKAPFLIFSGRECFECDANISIYIHSPANGHLNVQNGENRYGFPGTVKDYENNQPISKSRVFYGLVLPGIKGVIWYQEELTTKNIWQKSTFLVNLNDGTKKESKSKAIEKLKLTLQLLAQGSCKEIKGIDFTSEP
jgi:hypothetical protein